jgi:hypothetical protein
LSPLSILLVIGVGYYLGWVVYCLVGSLCMWLQEVSWLVLVCRVCGTGILVSCLSSVLGEEAGFFFFFFFFIFLRVAWPEVISDTIDHQ